MKSDRESRIEKILWSIALPGFGQLLNGKIVKGLAFIILEVIINTKSNINEIIILSFQGNTFEAVKQANYQWLMFYPCIYMFAIWDAYRDSGGHMISYGFLPFVLSAYLGTIGIIYSSSFRVRGILLGPIWLPMLCFIIGMLVGTAIQSYLIKSHKKS